MDVEGDMFPIGLRVLVVDDNLACLKILERLLLKCKYKVTISTEAVMALKMLKENKDKFDIVISDVHMPGMDGFKLLELIGLELDLPVIMLSANDDPKLVMKGVRHGAVDYLLKPVRIEELKNIWQHVIRKKQKGKIVSDSEGGEDGSSVPLLMDGDGNANHEDTKTRKRKEQDSNGDDLDDGDDEDERDENGDSNTQKKPRVVWSPELHKKFVTAVDQLGPDKAFPKKILDFMNVEGLTRENVASHLQKYRLYLKRLSSSANQVTDATSTAFGVQESSAYHNGGSLLNPYGAYCGLGSRVGKPPISTGGMLGQMNATAAYRSGLSHPASNIGKCLIPNQNLGVHFQQQNSNRQYGNQGLLTADVKPHTAVPSLLDYTRCMENWQNGTVRSTGQQNLLNRNNLPSSSFSGGFSTDDISQLQNALERSFVDVSAALCGSNDMKGGQYSFNAQNMVEPQRWQQHKIGSTNIISTTGYNDNPLVPNIDSSNQSFGQNSSLQYNSLFDSPAAQISGDGISSFMQNTEVQDSEADTLMKLDDTDSYLLGDTELLAGFTQNNCETLEDLVGGLLK